MSDLKFSCPACGQRILCDTSHRGMEMACPTCKATIIVPHESPFASGSHNVELPPLGEPMPPPAAPSVPLVEVTPPPIPQPVAPPLFPPLPVTASPIAASAPALAVQRTSKLAVASLVCSVIGLFSCIGAVPGIICGHLARAGMRRDPTLKGGGLAKAGLIIGYASVAITLALCVAFFTFFATAVRQGIQAGQEEMSTNNETATADKTDKAETSASAPPAVTYEQPKWLSDMAGVQVPSHPVSGKLHGGDFINKKSGFKNGELKLDNGNGLQLFIMGLADPAEKSSSYTLSSASEGDGPQIRVRWSDNGRAKNRTFKGGYSLKLQIDRAAKRKVHGEIYLCLTDDSKSVVAGTFTLTLPKPKP